MVSPGVLRQGVAEAVAKVQPIGMPAALAELLKRGDSQTGLISREWDDLDPNSSRRRSNFSFASEPDRETITIAVSR